MTGRRLSLWGALNLLDGMLARVLDRVSAARTHIDSALVSICDQSASRSNEPNRGTKHLRDIARIC